MAAPGRSPVPARASPDPALVEQVPRALRRANQALSARLRVTLRREGLPFSRFAILRLLVACGPTTSKRLALALGVTTPNMPALIAGLEAEGLVRRDRNRTDRREIEVRVTAKGRRVVGRLQGSATAELARAFDGWTDDELRTLLGALTRFAVGWRPGELIELPVVGPRRPRPQIPSIPKRVRTDRGGS